MMQRSIQEIRPAGKPGAVRSVLWSACLALVFLAGSLLSLRATWQQAAAATWWPALAAAAGIAVSEVSRRLRKQYAGASRGIRLGSWGTVLVLTGFSGALEGLKLWINNLIDRWNLLHDDNVALFAVRGGNREILAISLLAAFAAGEFAWRVALNRKLVLGGLAGLFLLLAGLLSGSFSTLGTALSLIGYLGIWISGREGLGSARTYIGWGVCAVVIGLLALTVPNNEMISVLGFREEVKEAIHTFRYGEDQLPMGQLWQAAKLNGDGKEMLTVRSEQGKNLYLRGYAAAVYQYGAWDELPNSAYGGEYAGMLEWLDKQGFDPLMQPAEYYRLSGENNPEMNQLVVSLSGASRSAFYVPSSLTKISGASVSEKKDYGLASRGFFGPRFYTVEEISGIRPSELTVTADWVTRPETEEQLRYTQAEAVYRDFVYETCAVPDPELQLLLEELFWRDYHSENDGIYSAVRQVREKLNELVSYTTTIEEYPYEDNPIRWFLTVSRQGNAAYYASAAAEALRVHGIPARYAEGYYVSGNALTQSEDGSVTVTDRDAHAWVEVYFDGIGWLPIDVTPGYYYDAASLQQMIAAPDTVRKTAVLEKNPEGAQDVERPAGESYPSAPPPTVSARSVGLVLLGLLAAAFIFLALSITFLELVRWFNQERMRALYQKGTPEEKIRYLQDCIFKALSLREINAYLGWNTKATDEVLQQKLPTIKEGEYVRITQLLEKSVYGGLPLAEHEMRTLRSFLKKLGRGGKNEPFRVKLRLRYELLFYFPKMSGTYFM